MHVFICKKVTLLERLFYHIAHHTFLFLCVEYKENIFLTSSSKSLFMFSKHCITMYIKSVWFCLTFLKISCKNQCFLCFWTDSFVKLHLIYSILSSFASPTLRDCLYLFRVWIISGIHNSCIVLELAMPYLVMSCQILEFILTLEYFIYLFICSTKCYYIILSVPSDIVINDCLCNNLLTPNMKIDFKFSKLKLPEFLIIELSF